MIVIFSEESDTSTTEVMDWLYMFETENILRINSDSNIVNCLSYFNLNRNQAILQINDKIINLSEIKSIWYRRGVFIEKSQILTDLTHIEIPNRDIQIFLLNESHVISEYVNSILQKKRTIGTYFNRTLNKLLVLDLAKKVGLKIPDTYILTNTNMKSILDSNNFITKALSDSFFAKTDKKFFTNFTSEIDDFDEKHIKENCFPSLIQKRIEKKFDLRTFFLNGKFYTMAIFSQLDKKTQVDFRKYNYDKPNRCVPFNLPIVVGKKIKVLFKKLRLNTGSLDLIYSNNNEYIFLEINPVGQFGMVSKPCNYYLEEKIAIYLCSKKNKTSINFQ
jgi:ATP-GRASP peptide maturase of grasp-with-spasm system